MAARFPVLLVLAVLAGAPVAAQSPVVLDPARVIALAETPWRDRAEFVEALGKALGGIVSEMPRLPESLRAADPFLWSVTGTFGADLPGSPTPGGIVACSRYGLATRDLLAARSLSDPEAFALFGATQAAADDAERWPEAGIARLACMITWDDTRRVAIIPEGRARTALVARFGEVVRLGDAEVLGEGWRDQPPRYGTEGYLLVGREGPADTVVEVESARIELRVAHQQIRFRAFLLNGGM
ncbi:hypothetical protein N8I71_15545 [Roseibacterium sp. SDUM158016]|uniref:hypothetical protein n=1 Tax=Roseicyclus sediminis TaxID=2980997 RepID=UPI0021D2DB08|nr:hypothetical protein [Roseibacterium sp. SDUM158016]MCU4654257.1 hypothetical protein [Roseibacterium sp. SDUM158016]